jgi:hypothetical protein
MSTATAPDNRVAKREALDPKPTPPVHIWATLGAALLVFEAYVVVKWVSGPYFQQVHSGPTSPPSWMKFAVNTVQIAVPVGCVVWTYWFLWRPWKRERRFTFEGLFTVAIFISSIYDPLSDYFQTWFTYNSYFFNRGNAMEALPGWMSISRPGEMVAWPLIFIPPTYVLLIGGVAILGSSVMRRVRRRWPALSAIPLVLSCYLFMMAFDFVLEGLIGLRLGLWEYEGGTGALSPDKFYKYPHKRDVHRQRRSNRLQRHVVLPQRPRSDHGRARRRNYGRLARRPAPIPRHSRRQPSVPRGLLPPAERTDLRP